MKPPTFPPEKLGAWNPGPLRAVLQRAGFVEDNFDEVKSDPRVLAAQTESPELTVAHALFSSCDPVPRSDVEGFLGPAMSGLLELGVLVEEAGTVRSMLRLEPDRDGWIATDHPRNLSSNPDHVMGIGRSTRILEALAPARAGQQALDLCSGSGWIALSLARAGLRVAATDVNARAIDYARFNARLAGIEGMEFLTGDLFEPVAGRRFDLITANPPFVISPDHHFTYRDSGCAGTGFCEKIARALPDHLAPEGTALMLMNWYDDGNDLHSHGPLRWLDGSGCAVWLFRNVTQSPVEYATLWLRDSAGGKSPDPGDIRRWTDYLKQLGATRVHSGFLIVHRGPHWTRSDVRALKQLRPDAGEDIRRVLDGEGWLASQNPDEGRLLEGRYTVPEHVRSEMVSELTGEGWDPLGIRLLSPARLAYDGPVDTFLLELIAACRKADTPAEWTAELRKQAGFASQVDLESKVAGLVRELIRHGILIPGNA